MGASDAPSSVRGSGTAFTSPAAFAGSAPWNAVTRMADVDPPEPIIGNPAIEKAAVEFVKFRPSGRCVRIVAVPLTRAHG
jgi:hypothetical protein